MKLSIKDKQILDELLSYIIEHVRGFDLYRPPHEKELRRICGTDTRPYLPYLAKVGYIELPSSDNISITLEGKGFYEDGGFLSENSETEIAENGVSKRRLVGIMFTDIKGFSKIMEKDESEGVSIAEAHQDHVKELVTEHNGRVISFIGDGSFSIFDSATETVECGMKLQKRFISENIPVRIGIHSGEVILTKNDDKYDVKGTAVNVASRIEYSGVPGAVILSKNVATELNCTQFPTGYLDYYKFKNIEKSIAIYTLSIQGLVIPKKEDLISEKSTISNETSEEIIRQSLKPNIRRIMSNSALSTRDAGLKKLLIDVINNGYPIVAKEYLTKIVGSKSKEEVKNEIYKYYFENRLWDSAEATARTFSNPLKKDESIKAILIATKDNWKEEIPDDNTFQER